MVGFPRQRSRVFGVRLALAAAALLGTSASSADEDSALAGDLRAAGEILPLESLITRAQALRPGVLLDARLEYEGEHQAYVYSMRMLDPQGQVWELELDARTGAVIEHDPESD